MENISRSEKRLQTLIIQYGSEAAAKAAMSEWGRKGGKAPKTKPSGFAADRQRAVEAGKKGAANRWNNGGNKQN